MGRLFFFGRLRVFNSCWIFCETPPFPPGALLRTVSGPVIMAAPLLPPFTIRREPWLLGGFGRGLVVLGAVGGGVGVDCCVCVHTREKGVC